LAIRQALLYQPEAAARARFSSIALRVGVPSSLILLQRIFGAASIHFNCDPEDGDEKAVRSKKSVADESARRAI
jgi:hypothetical protein